MDLGAGVLSSNTSSVDSLPVVVGGITRILVSRRRITWYHSRQAYFAAPCLNQNWPCLCHEEANPAPGTPCKPWPAHQRPNYGASISPTNLSRTTVVDQPSSGSGGFIRTDFSGCSRPVSFIAYVGGHDGAVFGPDHPLGLDNTSELL